MVCSGWGLRGGISDVSLKAEFLSAETLKLSPAACSQELKGFELSASPLNLVEAVGKLRGGADLHPTPTPPPRGNVSGLF